MGVPSFSRFRLCLRIGLALVYVSSALMLFALSLTDFESDASLGSMFLGMGLGAAAFAWLYFFVGCPKCRRRIFAEVVRAGSFGAVMPGLLALRSCPFCGLPE